MKQFKYVEDYLEFMAGYDPTSPQLIFCSSGSPISLARYDVKIIDNMAAHTAFGGSLTDRQAELCVRLVQKYRRQLNNLGIDISPIDNPCYRQPIRNIDRSRKIWLEGQSIRLRFPYDRELIDQVQYYKKEGQGSMKWSPDLKQWIFGLTEPHVNWVVNWGAINHFEITPEIYEIYNKILAVERTSYEIKLIRTSERFQISNAEESLTNYIEKYLGGFGKDNLIKLVDNAAVLGYTIDKSVNYPEILDIFNGKRTTHMSVSQPNALDLIFDYAELTDRWPVCVYNPGTNQTIDLSRFDEKEIVRFDLTGKTKTCDYNFYDVKVIYASKIPKHWNYDIPLLVSTVEMMFGSSRTEWFSRAQKIIYYNYIKMREDF